MSDAEYHAEVASIGERFLGKFCVYLIELGMDMFKIGASKSIEKRLTKHGEQLSCKRVVSIIDCNSLEVAKAIEQKVLSSATKKSELLSEGVLGTKNIISYIGKIDKLVQSMNTEPKLL